jgi:hypothetical protein
VGNMSAPSSNASDQSEEDTDEALDFAQSRGDRSANEASEGPSWARLTPPSPAPVHIRSATSLGPDYQGPGPLDVICGRGKRALRHPGNIALRRRIETKLEEYTQASTKIEKSVIVSSILDGVRDDSPGGGFVRFEKGEWFEVGDHFAREKIGQR